MNEKLLFISIFCGVWCFLGIIFLSIGIGTGGHRRRLERRCSERVWGSVADVVPNRGADGATLCPMVEYATPQGLMRQLSPVSSTRCRYAVGQAVAVWYDPQDPSVWYLEGDKSAHLLAEIFAIIGSVCIGIAVLVGLIVGFGA